MPTQRISRDYDNFVVDIHSPEGAEPLHRDVIHNVLEHMARSGNAYAEADAIIPLSPVGIRGDQPFDWGRAEERLTISRHRFERVHPRRSMTGRAIQSRWDVMAAPFFGNIRFDADQFGTIAVDAATTTAANTEPRPTLTPDAIQEAITAIQAMEMRGPFNAFASRGALADLMQADSEERLQPYYQTVVIDQMRDVGVNSARWNLDTGVRGRSANLLIIDDVVAGDLPRLTYDPNPVADVYYTQLELDLPEPDGALYGDWRHENELRRIRREREERRAKLDARCPLAFG